MVESFDDRADRLGSAPLQRPDAPGVPTPLGVPDVTDDLIEFGVHARNQPRMILGRFVRHKLAMGALLLLVLMALLAFLAPRYYPYTYLEETDAVSASPSAQHWFGTDSLGKDTYAKTMRGATRSMEIGLLVAIVSTIVGVFIGAVAGYYRGATDAFLMRFTDLFLVIPDIAVLLVVANQFRGQSDNWLAITIVIAAFTWMYQARLTRSEFLSLRERDFVRSARALGASDRRIIGRHMLPNCVGSIIVNATLTIGAAILIESTLSYLGFGVSPPDTSLGKLVADGAGAAQTRWWLFYMPGFWLIAILLCVNFVGDGLRDAFDPRQERVRT